MTNPNAVPKPWLVQVRDRFSDRWATGSGWASFGDLIPYVTMIAESLEVKAAEVRIFHQETGEVPFSAQNPACSICQHWGRLGICAAGRHVYHNGQLGTHQDFWCVLYKEIDREDDQTG